MLEEKDPAVWEFLNNFAMSTDDQLSMLPAVEIDGRDAAEVAAEWVEALPVGNGRLGAMVFGGASRERIQFNEETLWNGEPRAYHRPGAVRYLDDVRAERSRDHGPGRPPPEHEPRVLE